MTSPPALKRHSALRVVPIRGKGRGVITLRPIAKGTLLEVAPIIRLAPGDTPQDTSVLRQYPFVFDKPPFIEAIALGIVSLCNHSDRPNCWTEVDTEDEVYRLRALRDIRADAELTHNYGVAPWWK